MSLAWSCTSTRSLSTINIASLYTRQDGLTAAADVLNLNDSLSAIYLRFSLPSGAVGKQDHKGTFCINYSVFSSLNKGLVVDSASFRIPDSSLVTDGFIDHRWKFRAITGRDYFVKVWVEAPLKNSSPLLLVKTVSKTTASDGDWFMIQDSYEQPVFERELPEKLPFRIVSPRQSIGVLKVSCFFRSFPPAMPPFVFGERPRFDYKVDSIFYLPLNEGVSEYISFRHKGLYLFAPDSSIFSGLSVVVCDPGYPRITSARQMVESTRYITTSGEYEALLRSTSLKPAIDSFWIANAGNADRASATIRNYYSQVERANQYFTSFTEGWKTDRGMIYIVFGPPDLVYRSDSQEQWTYGEAGNIRSLRFYFTRVINPFTDNDYILERSEMFKTSWYNAVQLWRR